MTSDDQKVVVQVKGKNEVDLFVMFNQRVVGATKDAETYVNLVTIVEQQGDDLI